MITTMIIMIIVIIVIIIVITINTMIIIFTWTLGDACMEGGEVDERVGGDEKVGEEAAGKIIIDCHCYLGL